MTQDEIIEMARQAGFIVDDDNPVTHSLKAFAKLVAAKAVDDYLASERESELRARGEA